MKITGVRTVYYTSGKVMAHHTPLSTEGKETMNKKQIEVLEDVVQDGINEALEAAGYEELKCDKVEIRDAFFSDDYIGGIRIKIHD